MDHRKILAALFAVALVGCSSKTNNGGNNNNVSDVPDQSISTFTEDTLPSETSQTAKEIWSTDIGEETTPPETDTAVVNTVNNDPQPSPISGIELSYYDVELEVGDEFMPLVTMYPEDADNKGEIWTSSNEDVATVSDMGLIEAKKSGCTIVKVACAANPSVFATVSVRVYDYDDDYDDDLVHEIHLTDYNFDMDVGDTEMPYVSMYPDWADDFSEKWSSSDESVATVDSKGNIKAIAPGYTTVIVKSAANPDVFASVSVHVRGELFMGGVHPQTSGSGNAEDVPDSDFININDNDEPGAVKQINLSFYTANLDIGDNVMPIVSMYPDDADDVSEIWSTSDEKVATVDDRGEITAVGVGDCIVTVKSASNPEVEANVSVRVNSGTTQPTYIEGVLVVNKSYALPASYNPGIDPDAQSAFDDLAAAAQGDDCTIFVVSGFRSYDYQSQLYESYVAEYGQEDSDRFSARPGHSEHQTGLAFDVNTIDDSFADTKEYEWLKAHAHEYGFIIRYPEGKESITGYKFEPWHIRYLGKELAKDVHDSGLTLEEYLGIDSKYSE